MKKLLVCLCAIFLSGICTAQTSNDTIVEFKDQTEWSAFKTFYETEYPAYKLIQASEDSTMRSESKLATRDSAAYVSATDEIQKRTLRNSWQKHRFIATNTATIIDTRVWTFCLTIMKKIMEVQQKKQGGNICRYSTVTFRYKNETFIYKKYS